jgi:siderophore synthetase component
MGIILFYLRLVIFTLALFIFLVCRAYRVPARSLSAQQILSKWIEALGTETFKRREVTLDDLIIAKSQALKGSCQRLIQALFRERILQISSCQVSPSGVASLTVNNDRCIHFDSLKAGPMDSWSLSGSVSVSEKNTATRVIELPSELLAALSPLLRMEQKCSAISDLQAELDDSFANDILSLAFRRRWAIQLRAAATDNGYSNTLDSLRAEKSENPTALLEQWGTSGHPWHPNYKSKRGLTVKEAIAFSPEFESRLPITLAALNRDFSHVESMDDPEHHTCWWARHFPTQTREWKTALTKLGVEACDYIPLPVHPWQARTELPTLLANEIANRVFVLTDVVAFTAHPSMSFRTVTPNGSRTLPMIKLPVAVRMTSAVRTVSARSVRMGPRLSRLLQQMCTLEPLLNDYLTIVPERIGVQFRSKPMCEEVAKHVGALFRDNPASLVEPGELAIPVGSLFARDDNENPLLEQWISLLYGSATPDNVLDFYTAYLSTALSGLLGFYLIYGVAFEAHQQNTFVVMGADQRPSKLLIRDFGDLRIDHGTFINHNLPLALHDPKSTIYKDRTFVRDKLLHATFMCQLGELALLCASHWDIPHEKLWQLFAQQVDAVFQKLKPKVSPQRWKTERLEILFGKWPAKALLKMWLAGGSADLVERMDNPLSAYIDVH